MGLSFEVTKSDLSVDGDQEWVKYVFRRMTIVAGEGRKPWFVVRGAFPEGTIRTDKIHLSAQFVAISENHECASLLLQKMTRVQQDEPIRCICERGLVELWKY
jgi:hypothetical protein